MQAVRYTEDQILYGLREFWKYRFGSGRQIDLDKRIDLQITYDNGWDDDDLDEVISALPDLFSDLAKYFGFECSIEEWKKELGIQEPIRCLEEWEREIAPHFTFAALVRFIEKRATAVLFQPVVINKECRPAGVFYGLQQITKDVIEESNCFGPSTKIIDVLRGYKLEYFWSQLNWMTEYRILKLSSFWSRVDEYGCGLFFLGMMLATIATAMTQDFTYQIVMIIVGFCVRHVTSLYKHRVNPLPSELQTFRDLAMLIAAHDCDAVRKCEATEH
ncbi:hypothetical protein [Gimesia aquarii]|uniref:Uncharacterized protein n=1 Tax=Gimesia aquarii TaxID=2527964 RepID=A0A517WQ94_9PLAN|nr:hypothetical protein [Gimesia aquarii]QDU07414.1 hypothetical protein V202x_07670 [Gimesia aquarii]